MKLCPDIMSTTAIQAPAISARMFGWMAAMFGPLAFAPVWAAVWESRAEPAIASWSSAILIVLLVTVSATDLMHRRIPNWATYPAILWGLGLNLYASTVPTMRTRLGAVGLEDSALGFAALFVPMLIVSSLSGGGKGDVKLVGAIGTLLGVSRGMDAVFLSFLAAGAAMLCWAVWTAGPITIVRALWRRIGSYLLPLSVATPDESQQRLLSTPVPLAPSFAIGTLLVLFDVRFDALLDAAGF